MENTGMTTDTHNIQILLAQSKNDKNAAVKILKIYRDSLYKEAVLYTGDKEKAKEIVVQAFRNAYKKIEEADAETLESWLNGYVRAECIRNILPLDKPESVMYITADEVPSSRVKMPDDIEDAKRKLVKLLDFLTPSERLISVLKFRDQLDFIEIAELCDTSVENIKNTLSDAKKRIKDSNINLSAILGVVNKLYPYYSGEIIKKEAIAPRVQKQPLSEEEEFNTAVNELRAFFDTKTVPLTRISDNSIDDNEDPESEEIEKTFEMRTIKQISENNVNDTASSAKMIMAAAMSADPDDVISEREYNPRSYWMKRIIIGAVIAVLAIGIGVVFVMIQSSNKVNNKQAETEPMETVTAEPEESAEPEETNEPIQTEEPTPEPEPEDDGSIGSVTILVTDLTIRTGPGVNYEQSGITAPDETYTVYETAEADGYIWYRVGENQWIADLAGQYVTFTPKS